VFHLPQLLNIYITIFLLYTFFQNRLSQHIQKISIIFFALVGLLFGLVEYVKYINITNLSQAKIFIDIVTSLLIFITSLLILDKSPLLKVAPVFLLMMSLFYYENMLYLIYTVFLLFIFVTGIIYTSSGITIQNAFKYSSSIFIASLPIVTILFLVFPRISYKNSNFGFKDNSGVVAGFGDSVSFGSGERVLLSNRVAMEIMFKNRTPPAESLYFRVNTLYDYNKSGVWSGVNRLIRFKDKMAKILYSDMNQSDIINYQAVIYPTYSTKIPQLDYPLTFTDKAKLDIDYTLNLYKPLFKNKKFQFHSILDAKLKYINKEQMREALYIPEGNPKAKKLAEEIKTSSKSNLKAIEKLKTFFKNSKFIYTLKPPKLKNSSKIDEVVFKNKKGYCVHFSSSFAYILRAMGIPSRVVSGYRADTENMIKNYLVVRGKDAHSWVEAYIKSRGWIRIDPTKYAIVTNESVLENPKNIFWQKLSLKLLYFKYKIEEWILYYSRVKQTEILKALKENKELIIYTISIFILFTTFLYYLSQKSLKFQKLDEASKVYKRFLTKLSKRGVEKLPYEGAKSFGDRLSDKKAKEIIELYIKIKYSLDDIKSKEGRVLLKKLKKLIKEF